MRHLGGQRERLAAGAGAQIDDEHARRRRRSRGRCSWLPSSWTSIRPEPPGLDLLDRVPSGRRRPIGECGVGSASGTGQRVVARALEAVDPEVERRALEQGRQLVRRRPAGRSVASSQAGAIAGLGDRLALGRRRPGRAASRRTGRAARIVLSEAEHGGAPGGRRARPAADRAEDELAHRAPVPGAGVAARLEIAGDQRVGRRAAFARRGDDLVEQLDRRLNARRRVSCSVRRRIIGRLAGDGDVVDMAFAQAGIGDADELAPSAAPRWSRRRYSPSPPSPRRPAGG